MNIQYEKNEKEKSLLAKVCGDCDLYNSPDFFDGIVGKMKEGCGKLVVDFSEVAYLDSSGVGTIVRIIKAAKERQIILKFRGITGTPREVLAMTNILSLIVEE